jgi:hypothetical protein
MRTWARLEASGAETIPLHSPLVERFARNRLPSQVASQSNRPQSIAKIVMLTPAIDF